jgi:outer membrane protein TolC
MLAALMIMVAVPTQAQTAGRQVTLDEAVGLAVSNNRDVESARMNLRTARQQVREAWSSVFPTLDLDLSYTRNVSVASNFLPAIIFDPAADPDELVAVKFGADNVWNLQLRAEQPLFRATAFIGVGTAGRYESLQREIVRGSLIEVATRVKLAYYAALLADESVRLSENSVRRVRQTLDETRKMFEAGISSSYDVLRLEVELANLEPNLRRSRNTAAAAKRNLAVELAVTEMDSIDVVGALRDEDADEAVATANGRVRLAGVTEDSAQRTIDELVVLARENRSDLRQLRYTEQLRQAELRVEQSEYLPTVSLFGTYSIAAQQNGSPAFFGSSGDQRAYGRQVGVSVSLPIFAGFRRPARTSQKRTAIDQVRTQASLLSDRIESDVKALYEEVGEAHSRARAQKFAVSQAQRGYGIARAQYREGIGSQLELTDAEVALRQSEFNYAEAIHDWLTAEARLDQAIGIVPEIENVGSLALGAQ